VRHISALIIKFIMTAVILEIVLNIMTDLTFGQILWLSLITTVLSYAIGDLIMLPLSNNTVASITDALIAFVVLYMANIWLDYTRVGIVDAIISALVLGVGEYFFHKYVHRMIFSRDMRRMRS
jgi:uncharacterized protein (DUF2062 family)